MNAIFCVVHLDGRPVPEAAVRQALALLALPGGQGLATQHRGDGSWSWRAENVALGGVAVGPGSGDGRLVGQQGPGLIVAADARIDNREELVGRLGLEPGDGEGLGSNVLIGAAYRRWGRECVRHLLGDFVFVVWDQRQRRLFAACDPMAVRSLYYLWQPGRVLVLASRIQPLLRLAREPARVDELHLARFLLRIAPDPRTTFYRAVRRLPPAHRLEFSATPRVERYWSPLECPRLSYRNEEDFYQGFAEVFTEAVRCRIRGVRPVGTALSGGLDSSAITSTAARIRAPGTVHCFSAIFPSLPPDLLPRIDERRYMRAVTDQYPVCWHPVRADLLSPLAGLERWQRWMEGPFAAPNLYLHNAMFEQARRCGVGVFLDGIDGDTVVSYGFELLPWLLVRGRWRRLVRELQGVRRVYGMASPLPLLAWRYGLRPLLRPPLQRLVAEWSALTGRGWRERFPLDPDFAHRVGAGHLLAETAPWWPGTDPEEEHRRSLLSPVFADVLAITGRLAAMQGLEVCFPFFDRRLIEFCLGVPPGLKLRHGRTRWIMRHGLADRLPVLIRRRASKAGLAPNFNRTIQRDCPALDDLFVAGRPLLEPYVDMAALYREYAQVRQASGSAGEANLKIFCCAGLASWLLSLAEEGAGG